MVFAEVVVADIAPVVEVEAVGVVVRVTPVLVSCVADVKKVSGVIVGAIVAEAEAVVEVRSVVVKAC